MTHCRLMISKLWRRQSQFVALLSLLLYLGPASAQATDVPSQISAPDEADLRENLTNVFGSWIWADQLSDRQTCQFWRSFEIPATAVIRKARLRMTADNEFILYLDGRELGGGSEWREIYDFNVTPLISPGKHILAVKASNSFSYAGMLLGLRIDFADGQMMEIKSDQTWRLVPNGTRGWETADVAAKAWPAARIVAPFGGAPWRISPMNVNVMPTLLPIQTFFWQTGWFQLTLASVCGFAMLFCIRLTAQLAWHKKQRLLLQRERARIARDIHDDLGSRMTQLVLHGEVAQSELPADSNTRWQLDRMCQEARNILSTIDEILWAVNPRRDTLNCFASYVCSYAEEFLKPTPIQGLFEVDPEISAMALDLPIRRALLMAMKEALNNAVKHSGATELFVQIKCEDSRLLVVVQDNGKGFDLREQQQRRNGLTNMPQRMSEIGGTCTIITQPGKGCRIEFGVALKSSQWRRLLVWIRNPRRPSEQSKETKTSSANEAPQIHDSIER